MAKEFTAESVTKALHAAVERKYAGHVYEPNENGTCTYSETDAEGNTVPSCIVGHVIHDIDPEMFGKIAQWEKMNGRSLVIPELASDLDLDIPRDAMILLSAAQRVQDSRGSWGTAVRTALAELELRR